MSWWQWVLVGYLGLALIGFLHLLAVDRYGRTHHYR